MKTFLLLLLVSSTLLLHGCTDEGPTGSDASEFDRWSMLVNWADNMIIPSLTSFSEKTADLKSAAENFSSNPTQENLGLLRDAWEDAYLGFQHVSMFETGPASEVRYRDNLNTYPLCTSEFNEDRSPDNRCTPEIHENIETGSYNLELPSMRDVQGFPALDYLLYGLSDTDGELLDFYTMGDHAESYRTYLTDLTTRIDDLTLEVLNHWENTYRDEFVNNSGGGANSSVDMMVNGYLFYYEKHLRAGKVGIPAGVFSQTGTLPGNVEAYFRRDLSKDLLLEALEAVQNFFNGKHFNSGQNGESLRSYLDYLNTMKGGSDLGSLINNQFESARTAIQTLNENFVEQIDTDPSKLLSAYDELQRNVPHLKTDMVQALQIKVSYTDTDGD